MSQMIHTIRLNDVEKTRYMQTKFRALQIPEQTPEPEQPPEKHGKKIAWGPVLKIEQKEIEPGPV